MRLCNLVRDWYVSKYPTDSLGPNIKADVRFIDVLLDLKNTYHVMGVWDSLVRENIFQKLADICDVEYDYIYNKWLEF